MRVMLQCAAHGTATWGSVHGEALISTAVPRLQ